MKLKGFCPDLVVRIEYDKLYVNDIGKGKDTLVKNIDYVTSARKDAGGFTINAPWIPSLRPYDVVKLNPQYFSQDSGGANVTKKQFTILNINFDFATCDKINNMVMRCI